LVESHDVRARAIHEEAQAERMTGRIGVHLEVVSFRSAVGWLQHAGPEAHHVVVRGGKVFHPQVDMNLLGW
jgi:hypothetical protein